MNFPADKQALLPALFDRWNRSIPSMGLLSLAALLWAAITGVGLAIGYDVADAASSLGHLELTELSGRLLRTWHAWAGHLLVVFALFHVVEHMSRQSDRRMPFGVWLRTASSVFIILAIMLTGFMLRGDAEGALARQIVGGLLTQVPLISEALVASAIGTGDDLQIVYVHHAATATVLLYLFAIEHGRRIWPTASSLLLLAGLAAALGWVFTANLHGPNAPVIKGPWYFLAVQEFLHWMSQPAWIWTLVLGLAFALAILPRLSAAARTRVVHALAAALIVYVGVNLFASIFRGAGWQLVMPGTDTMPSRSAISAWRPLSLHSVQIADRPEGCLACHDKVTGLSTSHDPEALGCAICHLGQPYAPDADTAHQGMVLVPGNLDTAAQSCGSGQCHDAIVRRVQGSLMATVRGMIAVDRWVFGEQSTPDGKTNAADLADSPADTHLRQMCISCHLARTKTEPAPTSELSRGGGCVACHLDEGQGRTYAPDNAREFRHPALSVQVSNDSCFGCHSRSGRISLHYEGWAETHQAIEDLSGGRGRVLMDGRVLEKREPDAHQRAGMACIDCHTANEVMGDGRTYLHEEQATRIRCATCHRRVPAKTIDLDSLDADSRAIVQLRYDDSAPPRYLLEDRTGEPLTNSWPGTGNEIIVRGKLDARERIARPPAAACDELEGHRRLSCRACHASWVMQCIACHTQYDETAERTDLLSGQTRDGAWTEFDGPPQVGPPVLGLFERDGIEKVEPFTPGMIMTVNTPDIPVPTPLPDRASDLLHADTQFVRAFALAVPHTTTRAGRSCSSCHQQSQALGYGDGVLELSQSQGRSDWTFEARFETRSEDGLPQDAWIPFLTEPVDAKATRSKARALDLDSQRRTLRVGACLPCHDPGTAAGREFYGRWVEVQDAQKPPCRGPTTP